MVVNKLFRVFFFLATVPTTGTPSKLDSLFKSIEIPFFVASSSRLTQIITFVVKERIW